MSVIPLYAEQQTFYAPAFEVAFAGAGKSATKPMPRDVVRDVLSVTYKDSLDNVDSFDLVLNNWDADKRQPLFLGGEDSWELFELVQPGNEIVLSMGYQGRSPDMRFMTKGVIKTLAADFPESGAPTLTVGGVNVLDRFKGKQFTWAWPEDAGHATVRDSDIAVSLQGEPNLKTGKPGLGHGITVLTDPEAHKKEAALDYVMMHNQYPIVFLMERARRIGYEIFVGEYAQADDAVTAPEQWLWFGPSDRVGERTYKFERGKSLVSFRPTIATGRQVKSVTVLGWDRAAQKSIKGEATLADAEDLNGDLHKYIQAAGRDDEVVADQPVGTVAEAKAMAVRYMRKQVLELVEATGVVPGLPDLRAGRAIEIAGFGSRLDGRWLLKDTTHTINDSGYRTSFTARRERPGSA